MAYSKFFYVFQSQAPSTHYISTEYIKQDQEKLSEFNSFFIQDIEKARNSPNQTLKYYIEGKNENERINVDENRQYIESILSPDYLPDGRWPSLVEHRLSLMQQVAVNQIIQSDNPISSVNGPPGTGKTTLLKDIFAHLVVERAKVITNYSSPYKAFTKVKVNPMDQHDIPVIDSALTHFKMVVSSSNNGAVENISKDLPKISEIIRPLEIPENPTEEELIKLNFEQELHKYTKELSDLSSISSELINEESWGLFSGVFGRTNNINKVVDILIESNENNTDTNKLTAILNKLSRSTNIYNEFLKQKSDFQQTLDKITAIKKDINEDKQTYVSLNRRINDIKILNSKYLDSLNKQQNIIQTINSLKTDSKHLNQRLHNLQERIDTLEILIISEESKQKNNFLKSLFGRQKNITNNPLIEDRNSLLLEKKSLLTEIDELEKSLIINEDSLMQNEIEIDQLQKESNEADQLTKQIAVIKNKYIIPDESFWADDNYDERQCSLPWVTDELQHYRGLLFVQAMILHQTILIANHSKVLTILKDFKNRRSYLDTAPLKVENAWNLIHLIFPVISTTFASFGNMYRTMPKDFIDYLFIDEAGQAVPQAAVGALYRSKKAIVVGDPIQIEPVVTIDDYLLQLIRKTYQLPETIIDKDVSVQTLADLSNPYGYYKENEENKVWNGIPLWVHRRCLNPMFTIANEIAYEGKMVLPSYFDTSGKVKWIDEKGSAVSKQYVKEQGDKLVELLIEDWKNTESLPNVYIISPFSEVKDKLKIKVQTELNKHLNIDKKIIKSWVKESIGTVHTFQGKEADKVYFVTGTDETQNGAINWSCSKPNLINVAVTRAKKEFYIIGDKSRISHLPYYKTINQNTN
ncbi:ATPase [Macrococcus hajekii]|uniref:ATPase n=2 Tax=Macrococcus hajekii TaxID=198482 RepID=A0A4R6BJ52_9STAP|nr:ATPase [Macrococcus hajekii]